MKRRAFIAAIFGSVAARAIPTRFDWGHAMLEIPVDHCDGVLNAQWASTINASRTWTPPEFRTFVAYCKKNPSKYGSDLPPDGTRS